MPAFSGSFGGRTRLWAVSGEPMRVMPQAELMRRQARGEDAYRVAMVDFESREEAEAWLERFNRPKPLLDRYVDALTRNYGNRRGAFRNLPPRRRR